MKQIVQSWIVLFGIVISIGCSRKAYEESVTEEPLFTVTGKINGQMIQLASGQNGQLITSTKRIDPFGHPEYISQFSPSDCIDCGPSFTFILRDDYRLSDNNDSSSILLATEIPFMHQVPENSGLTYWFGADNPSHFFSEWMLGQNPLGNGNSIVHIFEEAGLQEVSLRLYHGGEIQFIITSTVDVGGPYSVAAPFIIEVIGANQWRLHPPATLPEGLHPTHWEINGNHYEIGEIEISPHEGQVLRMNYLNQISNQSGFYEMRIMEDKLSELPPSLNIYFKGAHEQRELFLLEYIDATGRKYNSVCSANVHRQVSMTHLGQSSDAIQGGVSELRLLRFDADLVAEDDSTLQLELRDFEVTTGFHP